MKHLNESINESMDSNIQEIKSWIHDNCNLCTQLKIEQNSNGQYIVNAKSVEIKKESELTNGNFEWGEVKLFNCFANEVITSLKGSPKMCQKIDCACCSKLQNIYDAPKKCEKFNCECCKSLTSLEGAPKECQKFLCGSNSGLISLQGAPLKCDYFSCSGSDNLTSLKGAPQKCRTFMCQGCKRLTSLDYLPKQCENVYCSDCGFELSHNEIKQYKQKYVKFATIWNSGLHL